MVGDRGVERKLACLLSENVGCEVNKIERARCRAYVASHVWIMEVRVSGADRYVTMGRLLAEFARCADCVIGGGSTGSGDANGW